MEAFDTNTMERLREVQSWNGFAASLVRQYDRKGDLSVPQWQAAERMFAKMDANAKRKEKAKADVDGSRIRKMFDDALANGKKRRALRAARMERNPDGSLVMVDGKPVAHERIVMTPAREPRTEIWVKVEGEFCGGIKDGKFRPNASAPEWLGSELQFLAADPSNTCRMYGMATDTCSCCGRTLTDPASIALGIGPICAEKWGI